MPIPDCITGESGLIAAQSVPSATLLPCFEGIPEGWERSLVDIDEDGTVIRFDSDRAGEDAAVFSFTEHCDLEDAVQVPSEAPGASRYEDVDSVTPSFRASRHYLFEGGCVTWEFRFEPDAPAALSIELGDRLTFLTRDALNEGISEQFIDRRV